MDKWGSLIGQFDFFSGPHCCGSRLDVKQIVPSGIFRRFASGGSFFVNYTLSRDVDMIRPNRIIDFHQSSGSTFNDRSFVGFEWTAPGNDFVFGRATRYGMECFAAGSKEASNSQEEITFDENTLPQPDVYGTRQSVTVQIPIKNRVLLCTIHASDEVIF